MQISPLFWISLTLNSVIYKQAEQMQNGHFTATLHFPEYQNAGVRAHCSLPAGGVGDGTPALQGSPAGETASRGGNSISILDTGKQVVYFNKSIRRYPFDNHSILHMLVLKPRPIALPLIVPLGTSLIFKVWWSGDLKNILIFLIHCQAFNHCLLQSRENKFVDEE